MNVYFLDKEEGVILNILHVKSLTFGEIECDFFSDTNTDVWMTREQIGQALGYADPRKSIKQIHLRHKDRLDVLSRRVPIDTLLGGKQTLVLYSAKGIYEICRWSKQPNANEFYDFVYDVLEDLRVNNVTKRWKSPADVKREIDIRDRNSRVRQANIFLKTADRYKDILSKQSIELLIGLATEVVAGQPVLPKPVSKKTYSEAELANELGVSARSVAVVANKLGLKNSEYGFLFYEQLPFTDEKVELFRFNAKGREVIRSVFLNQGGEFRPD